MDKKTPPINSSTVGAMLCLDHPQFPEEGCPQCRIEQMESNLMELYGVLDGVGAVIENGLWKFPFYHGDGRTEYLLLIDWVQRRQQAALRIKKIEEKAKDVLQSYGAFKTGSPRGEEALADRLNDLERAMR